MNAQPPFPHLKEGPVPRTPLFVPPEEYAEVATLGAAWDRGGKYWYLTEDDEPGKFTRWLAEGGRPEGPDEMDPGHAERFAIESDHACAVTAWVPCQDCGKIIQVICLYCLTGTVREEPLEQFTVSHISAVDPGTAQLLSRWPLFHRAKGESVFSNHCPQCHEAQQEMLLHSEPDQPFFDVEAAIESGAATVTALQGTVRVDGDEAFKVE